ncbi:type IV toxin-antitoxin system AbiEi family antitoxin domain-containing protein [Gordonia shandongensis]|uniref:type IV toxin-antitoxin system AbiEi family antitoxin domain-containing protein n=1 Tax=Gordonia shandongensis TaxID=376351 RepID=UPI00047E76E2|nr:type IV toxin-antitoxin system AbiEi family antitoxin domain-containing protein [Gordonia shandongensis]
MWTTDENGLIRRTELLDTGVPVREITRALRSGALAHVARGVYAEASRVRGADFPGQYLYGLRCIAAATAPSDGPSPVLSHESAAVIHGWPLLRPSLTHVHVTSGRESGGTIRHERRTHPGLFGDGDVVEVGGVRVTSPARTAVDVARGVDFARALAVFDAALAAGTPDEQIREHLRRRRVGVGRARYAYGFADGRSESPGESWSRAQMIEASLPCPDLQSVHVLDDGREARCDFDWDGVVIGEFDGRVKYERYLRPGERPLDALLREKEREGALRALGLEVIRWTWASLEQRRLVPMLRTVLPRFGVAV